MTKSPPSESSPGGLHHHIPGTQQGELQHHQHRQQHVPPASQIDAPSFYVNPQYLPGGAKSLSGISIRAYGLGIALGICSLLSAELAYWGYGIWRAPFFIAVLSLFHYLEFESTARYNPSDASTSSFLLLSNGIAYSIAHATAMLELVRVAAMRKAKTNFNHLVQLYKKDDHELVTGGVYAFSRHPSYFGFFWWALGTQVVLGNVGCFVAYAVVLWKFFSHRITHEERHLVQFFGKAYIDYRHRVPTRIPFIR
ncbi:hypothetical protein DV736_g738, partial [Chaetothyriales sp. CBS 134916]